MFKPADTLLLLSINASCEETSLFITLEMYHYCDNKSDEWVCQQQTPGVDLRHLNTTPGQRSQFICIPSRTFMFHCIRVQCSCSHRNNDAFKWFRCSPATFFISNNTHVAQWHSSQVDFSPPSCPVCLLCLQAAWRPLARSQGRLAARRHQHQREYNLYNMSPCISHSCLCERLTGLALAQAICLDSGSFLISSSSIDKFHVCMIMKCIIK